MTVDRMSPLDASFLHMEDNVSHMHIGSVAVFAGPPPPFSELEAMLRGKLALVPRYRQVARFVPFDLGRPVWVDDEHFNLEYHLRHTALPAPGSTEQLRNLVARLMGLQLDRARPLWEMWMVEGLADDRWVLVSKVHHAIVDGVSGAELLSIIMDLSPEPSPPVPDTWKPEPGPSSLELATQAISDMARSPYEQLRAARAALRVPRHALAQLSEVLHGVRSMANLVQQTPESSLNGPIGPHRRYAWTDVTVSQIKHIREHLGGTFNDVVLAAITGGFRDLLLARDESVDRVVRTLVPVSVRPRDASGVAVGDGVQENRVSAMFADLPLALTDPIERLRAVSAQMDGLKDSKQAMAGEALTSLTGFAPPLLLALGGRALARAPQRSLNTVTTNVPGPQIPLYCRGRLMEKAYGYVPLMGRVRVGIAIFSYNGDLTFGITGDYDTVPDIEVLCRGIERSMRELLDLADAAERRKARATTTRTRAKSPAKPRARKAAGGQSRAVASASNKRRAAG